MKITATNLAQQCLRYIAIVVLPITVILTTAWVWNKTFDPQEKVETEMQVLSLDQQQVITIHAGAKITRQDIPPTLPNPTVSTTLPEPTTVPTTEPTLAPQLYARLSHYHPPLGPPNCIGINWDGQHCSSMLTNGKYYAHWSHWAEQNSTACPKEFKLGTVFRIDGFGDYECVDRGGAINVLPDQTFFLDLLTPHMPYVHKGDIVTDRFSPSGSYVVKVEIVHTP
jgi:hypothetical protein